MSVESGESVGTGIGSALVVALADQHPMRAKHW